MATAKNPNGLICIAGANGCDFRYSLYRFRPILISANESKQDSRNIMSMES